MCKGNKKLNVQCCCSVIVQVCWGEDGTKTGCHGMCVASHPRARVVRLYIPKVEVICIQGQELLMKTICQTARSSVDVGTNEIKPRLGKRRDYITGKLSVHRQFRSAPRVVNCCYYL